MTRPGRRRRRVLRYRQHLRRAVRRGGMAARADVPPERPAYSATAAAQASTTRLTSAGDVAGQR